MSEVQSQNRLRPSVRVSVVSHDPKLLNSVPNRPFIKTILLSELGIAEKFRGESLAENRYLVGHDLVDEDFDYYGFVSARWDERFPNWPKLESLDEIFNELTTDSESNFLAPICWRLSKKQVNSWINQQDLLHPGMSTLLRSVVELNSIDFDSAGPFNLVMGNNFILSKKVALDFLVFWHSSFEFLVERHGLDFPFSYRCHVCGLESDWGIDRWARSRHAGFLMERVSALFFLSRPDLTPVHFDSGSLRPVKKRIIYRELGFGLQFSLLATRAVHLGQPCRNRHNQTKTD